MRLWWPRAFSGPSSLQALIDAGSDTHQEVKDVGAGKLVASVIDADGNVIGLIHPAWDPGSRP